MDIQTSKIKAEFKTVSTEFGQLFTNMEYMMARHEELLVTFLSQGNAQATETPLSPTPLPKRPSSEISASPVRMLPARRRPSHSAPGDTIPPPGPDPAQPQIAPPLTDTDSKRTPSQILAALCGP